MLGPPEKSARVAVRGNLFHSTITIIRQILFLSFIAGPDERNGGMSFRLTIPSSLLRFFVCGLGMRSCTQQVLTRVGLPPNSHVLNRSLLNTMQSIQCASKMTTLYTQSSFIKLLSFHVHSAYDSSGLFEGSLGGINV